MRRSRLTTDGGDAAKVRAARHWYARLPQHAAAPAPGPRARRGGRRADHRRALLHRRDHLAARDRRLLGRRARVHRPPSSGTATRASRTRRGRPRPSGAGRAERLQQEQERRVVEAKRRFGALELELERLKASIERTKREQAQLQALLPRPPDRLVGGRERPARRDRLRLRADGRPLDVLRPRRGAPLAASLQGRRRRSTRRSSTRSSRRSSTRWPTRSTSCSSRCASRSRTRRSSRSSARRSARRGSRARGSSPARSGPRRRRRSRRRSPAQSLPGLEGKPGRARRLGVTGMLVMRSAAFVLSLRLPTTRG